MTTTKLKYRLTPLNLLSVYFLFETVRMLVNAINDDTADLGHLFLLYYFGVFLVIIFIDFLIQLAFFTGKGSWKMLYLTQTLILVIAALIIVAMIYRAG